MHKFNLSRFSKNDAFTLGLIASLFSKLTLKSDGNIPNCTQEIYLTVYLIVGIQVWVWELSEIIKSVEHSYKTK